MTARSPEPPSAVVEPTAATDRDAAARRSAILLLALATLAAASLRLPFLATQSLWLDETFTVHVVGAGSFGELWHRIGATESTPPLFYLLTWGWTRLIGSHGEAALRALPALATIAAVPVAYLALRRLAGRRAALAAAALVAASPLLVSYALDARAYGLLVLVGLLGVWACGAALEAPTTRRLALWALAAAAAIWTHWFAGFLVLGEAVALLWLAPGVRRRVALASVAVLGEAVALLWLAPGVRRRVALASVAVLGAVAPLAGLLGEQTSDARAGFIGGSGLGGRIEQLGRQFAAGPDVPRTWLEAASIALFAAAVAVGTALTARSALAPRGPRRTAACGSRADAAADAAGGERVIPALEPADGARALLAIALVALLVPLALAATGLYDRFNLRNVLFLAPLAAALAAPALLRARGAPLAAYLALCVLTALWVQTDWRYENADWRGAIRRVESTAPGLPVIAVTPLGEPVAALYLHREQASAPLATRRAWLVVEPARGPGHRDLVPQDPPQAAALLAAFPSHREQRLHGFRLIELSAPRPFALDPAQLSGAALFAGR
jgi:Dolichyl-phosphate-mannose-protein mannosyltransferase